ncbi:hypothetical protein AAFC00_004499 [Neodothiora populina]|uniref:Rhodanese domain-containing protein n=1 Tax=Neodothiora populina TaxID=2781224 RepID=A0ABR3P2I3_9PEZI
MTTRRLEQGTSDPISYECTCPAREQGSGGKVLLFYRYFANQPAIPTPTSEQVEELASWHRAITSRLEITGKIRVAVEGFNVTVGGTDFAIEEYISACTTHWSFARLALSSEEERKAFFKPSPGCACVFNPATDASVRVCAEITPLGITNYAPLSWQVVAELAPAEFHRRCYEENIELLDLRNHYESRIGYFVDPRTRSPAVRPQIRRFSQFPRYYKAAYLRDSPTPTGEGESQRQILTYCTGGIRCEKATRWMAERDDATVGVNRQICTLRGGIAAYLDWVDEEIAAGRMTADDSLFKGKNYVFDARGAMSLDEASHDPVSQCHVCGKAEDRLSKCRTSRCHLVLVVCADCEEKDPTCCESCREGSAAVDGTTKAREMCECEKQREYSLWGPELPKLPKMQTSRRAKTNKHGLNNPVRVIE